jgi:glycosyltransferase involved in cell wall biosynthesis
MNKISTEEKRILVIATAAIDGGALTILLQFLSTISEDMKDEYVLFLSEDFSNETVLNEFTCIKINTSKWRSRIWHDFYGYNYLINKLKLPIKICINFQNVPSRIKNVKQIVYMHQSLPFYNYKWNVFKKTELKYWLYHNFYIFFIKLNKKFASAFIVQSAWLAKALSEKINYPKDHISVFKPGVSAVFDNISCANDADRYRDNIFVYPAAFYDYKNHMVLLKALSILGPEYLKNNNIRLILTIDNYYPLDKIIDDMGIANHVECIGTIKQPQLSTIYDSALCLLFPSKIESFGLPLIEAAKKGIHILAADLPYAREAVSNYKHAHFVDTKDAKGWSKEISNIVGSGRASKGRFEYHDDWERVHSIINELYNSRDMLDN